MADFLKELDRLEAKNKIKYDELKNILNNVITLLKDYTAYSHLRMLYNSEKGNVFKRLRKFMPFSEKIFDQIARQYQWIKNNDVNNAEWIDGICKILIVLVKIKRTNNVSLYENYTKILDYLKKEEIKADINRYDYLKNAV